MRLFSPGETFPPARFGISGATGAATNADSTPTLAVYKNGVLDGAVSVTVANPATGEYSFTFGIPGGYALGDVVSVRAIATVAGIALAPQEVVSFRLDSKIATRSVAGDAMALTGGERTTLYAGIWAAGTRTLTAISDSAGVTTLLSRLTPTRAAYLDALTALTEGRMVWLERLGTAMEQVTGLWRWTANALVLAPAADLSALPTNLVVGPLTLTIEGAGPDGVLEVRRGNILTVRAALKALSGQAINLTGATLTAKIVGLDDTDLVTGLTVTALQADEGTVTVVLNTTSGALTNIRRARLIITRTVGSSDTTSYPAQLLFGG